MSPSPQQLENVDLNEEDKEAQNECHTKNQVQVHQRQEQIKCVDDIIDDYLDEDDQSWCSGTTTCIIIMLVMTIIAAAGVTLAVIPSTRRLSVILFLLFFILLSCTALVCCSIRSMSERTTPAPRPVIIDVEPITILPKSNKNSKESFDDNELTLASTKSSGDSITDDDDKRPKNIFASNFPDVYQTFTGIRSTLDSTGDYIQKRIILPAFTFCRPTAMNTTGPSLKSVSASCASFAAKPDVECCPDVHCLRDEHGVVNLSGKYKLVHSHNFDKFLKAQKIPLLICKAVSATKPIHTYNHVGDSFRVQIDGFIKSDTTFQVDGPPTKSNIRHIEFLDYMTYLDDKTGIRTRKVAQNTPKNNPISELIVTRHMSKSGKALIMTSKAIRKDGTESEEAVQTFMRI